MKKINDEIQEVADETGEASMVPQEEPRKASHDIDIKGAEGEPEKKGSKETKESAQFQVRFLGRMLPDAIKSEAIAGVAHAYQTDSSRIEQWFLPEGVILKERAALNEVMELDRFFQQFGMVVEAFRLPLTAESEAEIAARIAKNRAARETEEAEETERVSSINPYSDSTDEDSLNGPERGYTLSPDPAVDSENNRKEADHDFEAELEKMTSMLKRIFVREHLTEFQRAPLLRRLGAYILDYFLFTLLYQVIVFAIFAPMGLVDLSFVSDYEAMFAETGGSLEAMLMHPDISALTAQVVSTLGPWYLLLYMAYFALQEKFWGASVGKRVLDLQVYSTSAHPELTFPQVLLRTALFFIGLHVVSMLPGIGTLLFIITIFIARFDPLYSRTLYDRLSNTAVGIRPKDKRGRNSFGNPSQKDLE